MRLRRRGRSYARRHLFRGEPGPRAEEVGVEALRDWLEAPAKILSTTFWTERRAKKVACSRRGAD